MWTSKLHLAVDHATQRSATAETSQQSHHDYRGWNTVLACYVYVKFRNNETQNIYKNAKRSEREVKSEALSAMWVVHLRADLCLLHDKSLQDEK